jgi:hypothetical protein
MGSFADLWQQAGAQAGQRYAALTPEQRAAAGTQVTDFVNNPKFSNISQGGFKRGFDLGGGNQVESEDLLSTIPKYSTFVRGSTTPDWAQEKENEYGTLQRGVESGQASSLGALNRMGLSGSGAEAATRAYGGEQLGRGGAEIESSINQRQIAYEQALADRENVYNAAKAAYEAGNVHQVASLMADYDRMTAEMENSRQQAKAASEGPGFWGTVANLGAAYLSGGAPGLAG